MEGYDLRLYRELWKARVERRIPQIWVDEGIIRTLVDGKHKRISRRKAMRLIAGESLESILKYESGRYEEKAFQKKLNWACRQKFRYAIEVTAGFRISKRTGRCI